MFFRRVAAAFGTALIVLLAACGQSPVLETTLEPQDFGTPQDDFGTSVVANSQGVFVAGWTGGSLDSTNQGSFDAFVRRYDGGKIWGKQFGTGAFDTGDAIAVDNAGNSYVVGSTYGALVPNTQFGFSDVYMRKYNVNGILQWTKQFGTTGFDYGRDVALDSAGNVFVLSNEGNNNFTLRKFSATATLLLTKSVTDATKPSLNPIALAVDGAGNVIVLTNWSNNTANRGLDVRLYKYTNTLTSVWQKVYSTPNHDNAYDLTTDRSSNLYFTLFLNVTGTGYGGHYVKMDSNGTVLFTRQLEPTASSLSTTPSSITTDHAGNVYIAGYTASAFAGFTSAGNDDIVVFKYNSAGTRQWVTQFGNDNYGSSADDQAFGIAVSDAVYVAGYSRGNLLGQPKYGSNDDDAFLAQLDLEGNILGIDQ